MPFPFLHISEFSLFAHAVFAIVICKTRAMSRTRVIYSVVFSTYLISAGSMMWMFNAVKDMHIVSNYVIILLITFGLLTYHMIPLLLYFLLAALGIRRKKPGIILLAPVFYVGVLSVFPAILPCDIDIALADTSVGQLGVAWVGYETMRYVWITTSLLIFGYLELQWRRVFSRVFVGGVALMTWMAASTAVSATHDESTEEFGLMATQPGLFITGEMYVASHFNDYMNQIYSEFKPNLFVVPESFDMLDFVQSPQASESFLTELLKIHRHPMLVATRRFGNDAPDLVTTVTGQAEYIKDGAIRALRTKESTIPFAEDVPNWAKGWLPHRVSAVSEGGKVFSVGNRLFAPLICLEIWSDSVIEKAMLNNPELFVVMSSLGAFGTMLDSSYDQIIYQSFLRSKRVALERGVPVAMVINGGGSFTVNTQVGERYRSLGDQDFSYYVPLKVKIPNRTNSDYKAPVVIPQYQQVDKVAPQVQQDSNT